MKRAAMTKMNLYWLREQNEEEPKEEAHPKGKSPVEVLVFD